MFEIIQSAEIIVVATLTAFFSAVLVTRAGSTIPESTIFTTLPLVTSYPSPFLLGKSYSSILALEIMVKTGDLMAFISSSSTKFFGFTVFEAFNSAITPAGTIHYCKADLTAKIANSHRS